jgi:TrmH family RNA methyltransferase
MTSADPLARLRAARGDGELAVLEGFHAVKHAVRFGAELLEVLAVDPAEVARLAAQLAPDVGERLAAQVRRIDAQDLEALTDLPAPRGVRVPGGLVALARRPSVDVAALLAAPGPGPVVLLDSPRHLGNVGAAIRVAAAAEAEALLVTGTADPWHPGAIRGAAGLQFALPVGRVESAAGLPRPLVALDPEGEPLRAELVPAGAVLAFGSERHGLSDETRAAAVATLALPMRDGVSSLNLAAAVAAVLYGLRFTR